jgi:GNAT superfamily N-acetyltransferase
MTKSRSEPVAIQVRPARGNDRDLMADWALAMAMETEAKPLSLDTVTRGIQAGLDDPARARYFIAEIAGEPAGTLMVTTEWSDWRDGWWWWIQSVYVAPDYRRLGVFRALFDYVRAQATADADARGLRLYVERENASAQRTYEFVGMRDAGYRMYELELPRDKRG